MEKKVLVLVNHEITIFNFRRELIEKLIDEHYEVYITFPKGEKVPYFEELGCHYIETKVDRHGINPLVDFKLIVSYIKLMKSVKPDVVLTYTIKPNIYGGIVTRLLNKNQIANVTGIGTSFQENNIIKKIIVFLYKLSFKKTNILYFQNIENENIFLKNKIKAKKQRVLPGSGVNIKEFTYKPLKMKDEIDFIFIGRIMKDKGIEEYLYASKELKKIYQHCNFHIIGFFEDEKYKSMITDYEKRGIIKYHGFQKNVKKFIENSDCIVNPSYHEGMSNVLLEAGAMGRPLIASNISGCKEIIEESINGFLFEPKNKYDLLKKMKYFTELSEEEKDSMSLKSRKKIENEFNRDIIISDYMKNIKKLTGGYIDD